MRKKPFLLNLGLGLFLFLAPLAQADFTAAAKNISNSPASHSRYPRIAHIPGTQKVFVIWVERVGTDDLLYFSRSMDGGAT